MEPSSQHCLVIAFSVLSLTCTLVAILSPAWTVRFHTSLADKKHEVVIYQGPWFECVSGAISADSPLMNGCRSQTLNSQTRQSAELYCVQILTALATGCQALALWVLITHKSPMTFIAPKKFPVLAILAALLNAGAATVFGMALRDDNAPKKSELQKDLTWGFFVVIISALSSAIGGAVSMCARMCGETLPEDKRRDQYMGDNNMDSKMSLYTYNNEEFAPEDNYPSRYHLQPYDPRVQYLEDNQPNYPTNDPRMSRNYDQIDPRLLQPIIKLPRVSTAASRSDHGMFVYHPGPSDRRGSSATRPSVNQYSV